MSSLEKLAFLFEEGYYAIPIMAFFEFVAIVTGLLMIRGDKTRLFFVGYLVFDFCILVLDCYIEVSPSHTVDEHFFLVALTNPMISCFELLAYYYYFIHVIKNEIITRLMRFLRIVFVVIVIVFVSTRFSFLTGRFSYVSSLIGALEFMFLLPPSFVYFYEILKDDPLIDLPQRPSFWTVTGIFFYAVLSIPFYLISTFLNTNRYEHWLLIKFSLFYLPFTINFVFLTKAFLCKKTLTI